MNLETTLTEMVWALVAHTNDRLHEPFPVHAKNAAEVMLATPEGKALAALVEAALETANDLYRLKETADAYREATK